MPHRTARLLVAIVAMCAAGCAREGVTPAKETAPAATLPVCGDPAPGSQRLESYSTAQVPGTYWVEMVFEGTEWRPAEPIAMPHHHATRLELTNVGEHPALGANQGKRLRFTIELTARDIRQVAGRDEWRATYQARIVGICVP